MDVHVPRAVTTALRLRSIDVLTAQEEGTRRLRAGEEFSGVVYAHQLRITIGQMVEDLVLIASVTSLEEWTGRIEYLPIG